MDLPGHGQLLRRRRRAEDHHRCRPGVRWSRPDARRLDREVRARCGDHGDPRGHQPDPVRGSRDLLVCSTDERKTALDPRLSTLSEEGPGFHPAPRRRLHLDGSLRAEQGSTSPILAFPTVSIGLYLPSSGQGCNRDAGTPRARVGHNRGSPPPGRVPSPPSHRSSPEARPVPRRPWLRAPRMTHMELVPIAVLFLIILTLESAAVGKRFGVEDAC